MDKKSRKLKLVDRAEVSTGRSVFRLEKDEVVDLDSSEKESIHPDPKKRIKMKDATAENGHRPIDADKLVSIGVAKRV